MSRLPIRLKLTIAFAFATAAVLVLAGVFVYVSVSDQLNDSIDETLLSRTKALAAEVAGTPTARIELGSAEDPEDSFSQVIRADGSLVDSTSPSLGKPVLDQAALARADSVEAGSDVGELPGVDGNARLFARPAARGDEDFVVVAGVATQDRDSTLSGLSQTFLITAPLALLLASLAGYGLAGVAMRPVERMRRQAGRITLERSGERLPLPASRDEIHRLGETLNQMLDRIESSVERERTFVADASHELRTPLAIVRAELELGMRPDRDLDAAREAMLSAQEEVIRLQALTGDLLALARSDGGGLVTDRTAVSIPDLLTRVRDRFAAAAEAEGRRLIARQGDPAIARIDEAGIESALTNLVENALRHGAGKITLSSRTDDDALVFEVSDEGAGFPDGFADLAFERFARGESGRTTQGHGLGLAIVKAVACGHGGTVSIPAGTGRTTVVLRIPDCEPAA